MFYYDVADAEDMRPRIYQYTICPSAATCISLDFQLKHADSDVDFITVFDGDSPEAPVLGTFGNASGSLISSSGCLTFQFKRDLKSLESSWSAIWKSRNDGKCVDLTRPQECENVEEICGPVFHERFVYEGKGEKEELSSGNSCLEAEHNSAWYRFTAAESGPLEFEILPDNGFDDYDWVLWKGDPQHPYQCPASLPEAHHIACNYAAARGPEGATGLSEKGDKTEESTGGNPYCKSFQAVKGEIFYLLVDDHSARSQGFSIRFGESVEKCKEPVEPEIVRIAAPANFGKPVIRPADRFSQYTQIIRINLEEKMNLPLSGCDLPQDMFGGGSSVYSNKEVDVVRRPQNCQGLVMALLMGLKGARIPAYSPQNNVAPLHYGDILRAAHRMDPRPRDEFFAEDSVFGPVNRSWWDAERDLFINFENAIEIISDEVMDRRTGRKRHIVRFIRLVWTDWEGLMPDFNMAVFRFEEVKDFLDRIEVPHPRNDQQTLSLKEVIEMQLYSGMLVGRSGKQIRTLQEGKFEADRQVEYENYRWEY